MRPVTVDRLNIIWSDLTDLTNELSWLANKSTVNIIAVILTGHLRLMRHLSLMVLEEISTS